jgi:hypothetical protein
LTYKSIPSIFKYHNVNKEFLPKNSPQKIPSKTLLPNKSFQKFLPKNSSQKISPKQFLPKNISSKKIPKKFPKQIPNNSSQKRF